MADGHVLIEVNHEGIARLKETNWYDFRLRDHCFEDTDICDQLLSQIKENVNDCLLLIVLDFQCNCSSDYWGEWDCEYLYNMISYTVLVKNYKEFYREQVTEEVELYSDLAKYTNQLIESTEYMDKAQLLINEWEEFYNEDFVKSGTGDKKSIL